MRKSKSRFGKALPAFAVLGVIAVGVGVLTTNVTARAKPGPLCGPTILYECTARDGSTEQVGLTRCEVDRYEKKNKATCEPVSF